MPIDYVQRFRFQAPLAAVQQPIKTNVYPAVRNLIMCAWNDKGMLNVVKTWLWTRVYYLQTARPFNWLPESNDLVSVGQEVERRLQQL
jgi:hypothetical protein